jgi:hypothetical protein
VLIKIQKSADFGVDVQKVSKKEENYFKTQQQYSLQR